MSEDARANRGIGNSPAGFREGWKLVEAKKDYMTLQSRPQLFHWISDLIGWGLTGDWETDKENWLQILEVVDTAKEGELSTMEQATPEQMFDQLWDKWLADDPNPAGLEKAKSLAESAFMAAWEGKRQQLAASIPSCPDIEKLEKLRRETVQVYSGRCPKCRAMFAQCICGVCRNDRDPNIVRLINPDGSIEQIPSAISTCGCFMKIDDEGKVLESIYCDEHKPDDFQGVDHEDHIESEAWKKRWHEDKAAVSCQPGIGIPVSGHSKALRAEDPASIPQTIADAADDWMENYKC